MLVFNIPKNEKDIIDEVCNSFDNVEVVEVDSLSADTIVQVIIPALTIAVPAASAIIVAIVNKARQVEVEWDGYKIKGTEKQVDKYISQFIALKEKEEKADKGKGKKK